MTKAHVYLLLLCVGTGVIARAACHVIAVEQLCKKDGNKSGCGMVRKEGSPPAEHPWAIPNLGKNGCGSHPKHRDIANNFNCHLPPQLHSTSSYIDSPVSITCTIKLQYFAHSTAARRLSVELWCLTCSCLVSHVDYLFAASLPVMR